MTARPLEGVTVWVTRPGAAGRRLAAAIKAQGGNAWLAPALGIEAVAPRPALPAPAASYAWWIYVSPNAARFGPPPTDGPARIAAVGEATASALRDAGLTEIIVPARADSEHLFADPAFQPASGARVLIVRGEGGREWLRQALEARGVAVDYWEVYRRTAPDPATPELAAALRTGGLDAAVVTSGEALAQLPGMLPAGAREALARLPLVVPSERVLQLARQRGYGAVTVAGGANDAAVLAALERAAGYNTIASTKPHHGDGE